MALSGKCWPRFVTGGGCGKHFDVELFGGIEGGGNGQCRGRTVHTPSFQVHGQLSHPQGVLLLAFSRHSDLGWYPPDAAQIQRRPPRLPESLFAFCLIRLICQSVCFLDPFFHSLHFVLILSSSGRTLEPEHVSRLSPLAPAGLFPLKTCKVNPSL